MSRELVTKKLEEIFRDIFDNDELSINENSSPENIEEWDSLAHVNIIVATEKCFGIKFTMKEVFEIKDVSHIVSMILNKVS